MSRPRLSWSFYPYVLAVLCASLLAVGGFSSHRMWSIRLKNATDDLEIRARLLLDQIPAQFLSMSSDSLMILADALADKSGARITIVDKSGLVLADAQRPHRSQSVPFTPEIRGALNGERGVGRRYSSTARAELLYVALPIYREGELVGALRVSVPIASLSADFQNTNFHIAIFGLVIAFSAALIVLLMGRRLARPIAQMKVGAERFAAGDFSTRIEVPGNVEMGGLAAALNEMAEQLDEKLRTLTLGRNEQEAILVSLREGVVAVDGRECILFVNRAASRLLGIDGERAVGRLLTEVIRVSELQQFISEMLRGTTAAAESEIHVTTGANQVLQVTGTELRDAQGTRIGLLVVLNDVTNLRRLEVVRREFVANVSHELKTPVTAIKGYVETLEEGAWKDAETARTFLERIARNADRLSSIIEDLLTLSRIEQEGRQSYLQYPTVGLREIVEAAMASTSVKAQEHSIGVGLLCPDDLRVRANATLIEQAVVNLLDNAIKYSEPGRIVDVEVDRAGSEVCVRVRDHGCGIAAEHLPRIFERFYRVDRARSRKLGGTGLGLAIVKHIVQAHGGRVDVESTPGVGSTFSIYLPLAERDT